MNKQAKKQSLINSYYNIIKYHGLVNGIRRVVDQFIQNDLYDIVNSTNFTQMMSGNEFYNSIDPTNKAAVMHYQPIYANALKDPLWHLVRHFPVVGASSACFLDLGCGRGKGLHIARSVLQHINLVGVELNSELIQDAYANLGVSRVSREFDVRKSGDDSKVQLLEDNVNDVDYDKILAPFDAVIVMNKNSFDKVTAENTLNKIRTAAAGKKIFYVYSNPVFEELFLAYDCVFSMSGWHKNWNTKVFDVS